MNIKLLFFCLTLGGSLCASLRTKINHIQNSIEKSTDRIRGEKKYRRIIYKRENGKKQYKRNKKNLLGYFSLLGMGLYAGEEALSLYKKFKKENSVEGILKSECGQRYVELIATLLKPHIIAALEEKNYKFNDILIKKKVFRGIRNNFILPDETLKVALLIPIKYQKTVLNEALNNDIVKNSEIFLSSYVTAPLLQEVLLNQAASDLSREYAKQFVAYMLSEDTTEVPDFIIKEFQSDLDSLKKMGQDVTYLSATVITPAINNFLLKSIDKISPIRTICVGVPALTIPAVLFSVYREKNNLCEQSYNLFIKLDQFAKDHQQVVDQLTRSLGYYQELVTPEHLFIERGDRPVSVMCSYVGSESKRIGQSVGKKIADATELPRLALKNRPSDAHRGIRGSGKKIPELANE